MLLGVDVGGTFTDAVLLSDLGLHTAKVPSTPEDQSSGVIAAVETVLERAGVGPDHVEGFTHGMTVGTNALLEERGARTALVATRGFADMLEIGRQARPSLYRPCAAPPGALVDRGLRFEAQERNGPDGTIEDLSGEEIERLVAEAIPPRVDLEPAGAVLDLQKTRLPEVAQRHDASCDRQRGGRRTGRSEADRQAVRDLHGEVEPRAARRESRMPCLEQRVVRSLERERAVVRRDEAVAQRHQVGLASRHAENDHLGGRHRTRIGVENQAVVLDGGPQRDDDVVHADAGEPGERFPPRPAGGTSR